MSCIAAICDPNTGIVIAGDGIAYEAGTGKIAALVSKLILVPDLNMFVAATGMGGVGVEFLAVLQPSGLTSFDEIVDNFTALAREAYRIARWRFQQPEGAATVLIGGWSERHQSYEMHRICAQQHEVLDTATGERLPDAEAWTPVQVEGRPFVSSWPDQETADRFGLGDMGAGDESAIDWVARVVCAARAQSGPSRYIDGEIYQVGGFLQIAWLNKSRTVSWIAHRWPETIGETLDPSAGEAMPGFPLVLPV